MLVDLRPRSADLTGIEVAQALEKAGIICNYNAILNDPRPPRVTSGIRLGTPALTTRGLKEDDLRKVAEFIDRAILSKDDAAALGKIRADVAEFAANFPMPH
jgi:glycine hydroxymethyltransferase